MSAIQTVDPTAAVGAAHDGHTRAAVVKLLLEDGPISATGIGERLGLTPAGVRRHLDALMESGDATAIDAAKWESRGRGRPAKRYQLTAAGRGKLNHTYDDLAGAALRQLREIGGDEAIAEFARRRVDALTSGVVPVIGASEATGDVVVDSRAALRGKAAEIAARFSAAGFAATTRDVGVGDNVTGVQLCQHHCPVSHVAEEFPELCTAELDAFRNLLGTHVQRLATIANGDCACTTHVPLTPRTSEGAK